MQEFNKNIFKYIFILKVLNKNIWYNFVSVYFIQNKDKWNNKHFENFLKKIVGFMLGYAFVAPSSTSLKTPIFSEMINIVKNVPVTFTNYKINKKNLIQIYDITDFYNSKNITKSILAFHLYKNNKQEFLSLNYDFHIEHIYAKKRYEIEPLSNEKILECLGNKTLLEIGVNVRASDYPFNIKKKFIKKVK